MDGQAPTSRRAVLRAVVLLGAGTVTGVTACSSPQTPPPRASPPRSASTAPVPGPISETAPGSTRILLAYFSRPGENYYYGGRTDLEVGNTQVLAEMISELIDCDVHRIEAAEAYSDSYDATVERNVREQETDARPAIANPLASIEQYDTVLVGSPIWNVRAPMIMSTFTEAHDFTGKTVYPFVTYAVSGLGSTERDYAASCPGARIGQGLAVRGEEVREHRSDVEAWLSVTGLLTA